LTDPHPLAARFFIALDDSPHSTDNPLVAPVVPPTVLGGFECPGDVVAEKERLPTPGQCGLFGLLFNGPTIARRMP
jgi:hypothetical protein